MPLPNLAQPQPVELPAGQYGLISSPNRLQHPPGALLEAEGLSFNDDSLRKAAGATRYDTSGLANAPIATATWSTSVAWMESLGIYTGSGGVIAHLANLGSGTQSVLSITITVGSGAAVSGSVVVVGIGFIPVNVANVVASVVDSKGNTYTQDGAVNPNGSGFKVYQYSSKLGTGLAINDTITVTLTGPGTPLNGMAIAAGFSNLASSPLDRFTGNVGTGTAASSGLAGAAKSIPLLNVSTVGATTGSPTFTAGATFTQSGSTVSNGTSRLAMEYRIDTTSPKIIAMADWWRSTATQRLVTATTDGNNVTIYRDDGAGNLTSTSLASGLTNATLGVLVAGRETSASLRCLFYADGTNPVKFMRENDGSPSGSMATITAGATDWSGTNQPTNLVVHRNRLWACGNANKPHTLYGSKQSDYTDFQTVTGADIAVSLWADAALGDRLWGLASFNGLLWAWKHPRGIFWLDDTDADVTTWALRTKSQALGCAPSPYAILPLDDDVLFLSADGQFHLLSSVANLTGVYASNLSRALRIDKWLRDNLNLAQLGRCLSAWYPHRREAYFGLCKAGSTTVDTLVKFDFSDFRGQDVSTIRVSYDYAYYPNALTLQRDANGIERPLLGEAGRVYRLDQSARAKDGAMTTGSYRTTNTDLGWANAAYRGVNKQFEDIELYMDPVSAGTLTMDVYIDNHLATTLTFDATKRHQHRRIGASGREISLKAYNSTANEDFNVLSHLLWVRALGREDRQ